jgi:hypothetical protein
MAVTTQSVLVICRSGPATYYYRGVRLSDNASIELANAVRSSDGWNITNPSDGTRYQLSMAIWKSPFLARKSPHSVAGDQLTLLAAPFLWSAWRIR